jgi:PBP1b-binding outer membrane lipoprotein LpoB
MTQATGYKQTSNKELPTNYQGFSYLIPATYPNKNGKDTADDAQKYPMYVEVDFSSESSSTWKLTLIRIANIQTDDYKFTQTSFNRNSMKFQYATGIEKKKVSNSDGTESNITTYGTKYCSWSDTKPGTPTVTIQL